MSYAPNTRAPKPDYDNLPQEPTGPVAQDSLAAESLQSGGGFSQNDNAEALGVKGANSTLNTTDTSGATTLHSAPDGTTRAQEDFQAMGSDERGVTGVKYPDTDASTGSTGYSGGTGDSFAPGATTGSYGDADPNIISGSSATQRQSYGADDTSQPIATGTAGESYGTAKLPQAGDAPNYAGTVSGAIRAPGELKPKGDDLTEGGIPQTKTFTGDVGGPHDPGRLAERDFQGQSAQGIIEAGADRERDGGDAGDNPYDVLSSERAP